MSTLNNHIRRFSTPQDFLSPTCNLRSSSSALIPTVMLSSISLPSFSRSQTFQKELFIQCLQNIILAWTYLLRVEILKTLRTICLMTHLFSWVSKVFLGLCLILNFKIINTIFILLSKSNFHFQKDY